MMLLEAPKEHSCADTWPPGPGHSHVPERERGPRSSGQEGGPVCPPPPKDTPLGHAWSHLRPGSRAGLQGPCLGLKLRRCPFRDLNSTSCQPISLGRSRPSTEQAEGSGWQGGSEGGAQLSTSKRASSAARRQRNGGLWSGPSLALASLQGQNHQRHWGERARRHEGGGSASLGAWPRYSLRPGTSGCSLWLSQCPAGSRLRRSPADSAERTSLFFH